jgi:hypothetical protein
MKNAFSDHKQISVVSSFSELLIGSNFQGDRNAICWYRNLNGDFQEIVKTA